MYKFFKRTFDISFGLFLIILFLPIIFISIIIASVETKSFGVFKQVRIGFQQEDFTIFKVKTMMDVDKELTQMASIHSQRITKSGRFFRRYKIDELPQLLNVILGDMSFVGPRPDTLEMYNILTDEVKSQIFSVRPGITSLASVVFYNEESLLSQSSDPQSYYENFILPEKIKLNVDYVRSQNFILDFKLMWRTVFKLFEKSTNKRNL